MVSEIACEIFEEFVKFLDGRTTQISKRVQGRTSREAITKNRFVTIAIEAEGGHENQWWEKKRRDIYNRENEWKRRVLVNIEREKESKREREREEEKIKQWLWREGGIVIMANWLPTMRDRKKKGAIDEKRDRIAIPSLGGSRSWKAHHRTFPSHVVKFKPSAIFPHRLSWTSHPSCFRNFFPLRNRSESSFSFIKSTGFRFYLMETVLNLSLNNSNTLRSFISFIVSFVSSSMG